MNRSALFSLGALSDFSAGLDAVRNGCRASARDVAVSRRLGLHDKFHTCDHAICTRVCAYTASQIGFEAIIAAPGKGQIYAAGWKLWPLLGPHFT